MGGRNGGCLLCGVVGGRCGGEVKFRDVFWVLGVRLEFVGGGGKFVSSRRAAWRLADFALYETKKKDRGECDAVQRRPGKTVISASVVTVLPRSHNNLPRDELTTFLAQIFKIEGLTTDIPLDSNLTIP